VLQDLLLCFTVAIQKELRLLATFAWAREGAAGAAFAWLLRLRATGRYRDGAGAGGQTDPSSSSPYPVYNRKWKIQA